MNIKTKIVVRELMPWDKSVTVWVAEVYKVATNKRGKIVSKRLTDCLFAKSEEGAHEALLTNGYTVDNVA